MATFGKTTKGLDGSNHEGSYIWFTKYTCPEIGTGNFMKSRFKNESGVAVKVKTGIWNADLSFLIGCIEVSIPNAFDDWQQFNFTDVPNFINAVYLLGHWTEQVNGTIMRLYYDDGAANSGGYNTQAYNGFPDPLVPDHYWTNNYSIYVDYTPTVEERPLISKPLISPTKVGIPIIRSFKKRFPKLQPRMVA